MSNRRLQLAVLIVSVSSFALLQSMVVPVLGTFREAFHTDQATTTWVLTGYFVSACVATPLLGRAGDSFGKRRMLVASLLALVIGSLGAALAPDIGCLIAARVVQGLGGGVLPLAFGIVRDSFPRPQVRATVGLLSALAAAGFGVGIVVAGPIVGTLGFRWLFWLPMGTTAVAALGAVLLVPESGTRRADRLSALPAALLVVWLVCLLLCVTQVGQWGWRSPRVMALLSVAAVALALWVWAESTARAPVIDLRLLRVRGVWSTSLVVLLVGFGLFAGLSLVPQFVETPRVAGYGFGASITDAGLVMAPAPLGSFLGGLLAARLARTFGSRAVIATGCSLFAVAYLWVMLAHEEIWQICVTTSLQGLGTGLVQATLATVVIISVLPEQSGLAGGLNANLRNIGGACGTAVVSGVVTMRLDGRAFPHESHYTIAFGVIATVMVAAALASIAIPPLGRISPRLGQP